MLILSQIQRNILGLEEVFLMLDGMPQPSALGLKPVYIAIFALTDVKPFKQTHKQGLKPVNDVPNLTTQKGFNFR